MKLLLILTVLALAAAHPSHPSEWEHDAPNRELTERELQSTITCLASMRDLTIQAHECSWVEETNIFNLKVLFGRDISSCFDASLGPVYTKKAFFWSNNNLHEEYRLMPYSNSNPTCLLDTSAVNIFDKCADWDNRGVIVTSTEADYHDERETTG